MKINLITSILIVFITYSLNGQINPCDCCSYNSLAPNQEYEKIFPPSSIKNQGIKQFTFYTLRKNLNEEESDTLKNDYKEIQFNFDKNGYIKRIVWHNRMGIPHSNYIIERNVDNKYMTSKTFQYLDESGNLSNLSPPQTTDYFHDERNRLIKIKARGYNGEILPDSLSSYTKLEHDEKGRVINSEAFTYYDWTESPMKRSKTVYYELDKKSKSEFKIDSELILITEDYFDDDWRQIKSINFNQISTSPVNEKTWKYDNEGKLIYFSIKTFKKGGSECPEDGNFEEKYLYDKNGILEKVIHKFDGYECIMRIKK